MRRLRRTCTICGQRRLVNWFALAGSSVHVAIRPEHLTVTTGSVVPVFTGPVCRPCRFNDFRPVVTYPSEAPDA